ncbi:ninein-like protein [Thrips palmi]|uniref:Ninein-like protein n=1 Tax=Thrips palmi TaxID=161013 RepID=A0A6P9ADL1_THRPL|nr:ninein-like protein [Thrips palmi]XP_034255424.1 ninein-like protein [Thrips palmi]
MDMSEADPYEHQLRALFESFDSDNLGSLNHRGLQQLCEQLPLDQSQSADLISALLPDDLSRISFTQFWSGLLTLLGGERSSPAVHGTSEKVNDKETPTEREESPEREVSPKLVLGQKKYGRRSRPESSELEFDPLESDPLRAANAEKNNSTATTSTEDEGEDQDIVSNVKKRRTAENLANYPKDSQSASLHGFSSTNLQGSLSQAEDCLKVAWQQYGKNGFVSQLELGQVCQCIGIEKFSSEALQQLFEQLDSDRDGKVSLDDFLLLFRSGMPCTTMTQSSPQGTWVLGSSSLSGGASLSLTELNGAGMASADAITEMWESVGVSNPSLLLRDLNLDDSLRSLNVASVACAIEEEVARQGKSNAVSDDSALPLNQGSGLFANNLLLAALTLRQAEVRWIRSSLEQMSCERDKLRNDLAEANFRASLLAQEIDDHHSKLEKVSQNQFKLLEQKHSEVIRDLTARFSLEREQLAQQINRLEHKVTVLQQSESRLSSEAASLRQENEALDQESRSLAERVAECEEAKLQMGKELQEIEHLQQRLNELQANQDEDRVEHLCEQISKLRSENSSLRDRNDELTVELESLTTRLSNVRVRRQAPTPVDGNLSGGTKRRGNSPLAVAPADDSGDEESPRVGKVRRFSQKVEISLDNVHIEGLQIHPLAPSEPGIEADLDLDGPGNHFGSAIDNLPGNIHLETDQWLNLKSESSSLAGSQDDLIHLAKGADEVHIVRLQARIKELERALHLQTSSSVGSLGTKHSDLQTLKEIEADSLLYLRHEETPTTSLKVHTPTCDEGLSQFQATASLPGVEAPSVDNPAVEQLQQHCRVLETQLDNVKVEIVKILSEKRACSEENCVLKKRVFDLSNQLPAAGCETHPSAAGLSEVDLSSSCTVTEVHSSFDESHKSTKVDQCVGTNNEDVSYCTGLMEECSKNAALLQVKELEITTLRSRCSDLEKSLSMMRDEYERCEDYWAGKLDEERQLAEQEQQITDEKFSELMSKIREYEDLFADDHMRRTNKSMDGRLETIEEQDGLEKQVTLLEEELEEVRCQGETKLVEKEIELQKLRDQLHQLQLCHLPQTVCSSEIAVQVSDLETRSWGSDRTFIVKPRVVEKDAPVMSVLNGNTTDNVLSSTASSLSSSDSSGCSEEDARRNRNHQPHGRHRRMRHHPPYIALNCLNPEDELQAVGLRLREQEQTCVRLQRALRGQQQQTQALLQHTWDRHKQEMADIQFLLQCTQDKLEQQGDICRDQMSRLTKSDVLVKELYVENAHLLASIQSLEERCLLLLQQKAMIGSGENCSSV